MNLDETILYTKDANGVVREWAISCEDWDIVIRHGQLGGAMQYQHEEVPEGKAGRSRAEQVMSRMASRISSQRDKGYVNSLDKLGNKVVNALGLEKPMLAHKLKDVRNMDFKDTFIQRKYDGNRCLITKRNGETFAYTRNGKRIDTIDHIIDSIQLQEGQTVDGELYCHGQSLQTIVSWIKRKQDATTNLRYHMYDCISDDSYWDRLHAMKETPINPGIIEIVPTYIITSMEEAMKYFREFRNEGFEGAIVRWGNTGYEDGKRSRSLVKIKEWQDAEFKVVDIHTSADGWGILECLAANGETFRVSAPGNMNEKFHVAAKPEMYLGKYVTVEYAQLTKDGIPFHPIATVWDKHH